MGMKNEGEKVMSPGGQGEAGREVENALQPGTEGEGSTAVSGRGFAVSCNRNASRGPDRLCDGV